MLTTNDLLLQDTMPQWADISLTLYKEFSESILFKTTFRYYTADGKVFDVNFKEWGIYHMLAIHHIDYHIKNEDFFCAIDNGLDFATFRADKMKRYRLMDNKDRIRMFACVYQILKNGNCFYVQEGKIPDTDIKVDYLLYKLIDEKGINVGIRYEDNTYVPLTLLVDRAINPTATIDKLKHIDMEKLEIIEDGTIKDTIIYSK